MFDITKAQKRAKRNRLLLWKTPIYINESKTRISGIYLLQKRRGNPFSFQFLMTYLKAFNTALSFVISFGLSSQKLTC